MPTTVASPFKKGNYQGGHPKKVQSRYLLADFIPADYISNCLTYARFYPKIIWSFALGG